jgi:hypothetical protein
MRRVISLFLPRWPSDRLRRVSRDLPARGKPLVTALMHGQRRILASVDDAAARLGLTCGMTVTHAQSLVPDLCVVNATPEEDEAALFRLALWCIRFRLSSHRTCPTEYSSMSRDRRISFRARQRFSKTCASAWPRKALLPGRRLRIHPAAPGRWRVSVAATSSRPDAPRKPSPAFPWQRCELRAA